MEKDVSRCRMFRCLDKRDPARSAKSWKDCHQRLRVRPTNFWTIVSDSNRDALLQLNLSSVPSRCAHQTDGSGKSTSPPHSW